MVLLLHNRRASLAVMSSWPRTTTSEICNKSENFNNQQSYLTVTGYYYNSYSLYPVAIIIINKLTDISFKNKNSFGWQQNVTMLYKFRVLISYIFFILEIFF